MSFDEWFEKEEPFCGNEKNNDAIWAKKFMRQSYKAGAKSQQAEIDKLKQALKTSLAAHECVCLERDELQKRIDEALTRLNNTYPENWGYEVTCAIGVLRGEEND